MTVDHSIISDKFENLFLSYAYTRDDVLSAIERVRDFFEFHFFEQKSDTTNLLDSLNNYSAKHQLSIKENNLLQKLVQANDALNPTNLYATIEQLHKLIDSIPILTVYIPVMLDPDDIDSIGSWLRTYLGKKILISFIVDPSYIGGCGISWKGSFKDYSLKNFQLQQQKIITDILSTVLSPTP